MHQLPVLLTLKFCFYIIPVETPKVLHSHITPFQRRLSTLLRLPISTLLFVCLAGTVCLAMHIYGHRNVGSLFCTDYALIEYEH